MNSAKFFIVLFLLFSFSGRAQEYTVKQIDSLLAIASALNESDPEGSLVLCEKIYKRSTTLNYTTGKMKSLEHMAYCHYVMGEPEKSIPYTVALEKEALKIEDFKNIALTLRIKAACYALLGQDTEADKIINKAFKASDKIVLADDRHSVKGLLHQARGTIIINLDDKTKYPLLFGHYKKSLDEFLKVKSSPKKDNNLADAYSNLAGEYSSLKKYNSAQLYYQKALDLSKATNNLSCEYKTLYAMGTTLYEQGKYKDAIDYFLQVEEKARKMKDPYTVKTALDALYFSYKEIQDPKWQEYLAKHDKLKDSLAKAEKASLKVPIEQIVAEKENEFSKEKSGLYLIIVFAILAFVVVFYFGYRYFKNFRQEKEAKHLKEQLLVEKDNQLVEMKLQLDDSFEKVIEMAKKDDPLFVTLLKELYPTFYQQLVKKKSDLTLSELKVCFYIRLKFSTKEIAEYAFVTPKAIQNRKNRLRKRLGIHDKDDIYLWMEKLDIIAPLVNKDLL